MNETIRKMQAAAAAAGNILGRRITYVPDIDGIQDPEPMMLRGFEEYGAFTKVQPDGSILLAMKPVEYGVDNRDYIIGRMLKRCLYPIAMKEGPAAFLKDETAMRDVMAAMGLPSRTISKEDMHALILSAAKGPHDVPDLRMGRAILSRAFGYSSLELFPHGSTEQLCRGLVAYRRAWRRRLELGGTDAEWRDFAKDNLSKYAAHKHLHLGMPQGGMKELGYPDFEVVMNVDMFTDFVEGLGMTPEEAVDAGMIEKMRNPLCIIPSRLEDHYSLVLDMDDGKGRFVTVEVMDPEHAMQESQKDGMFPSTHMLTFMSIKPNALLKVLCYTPDWGETYPNVKFAKRTDGAEEHDIVAACRRMEKKAEEGRQLGLYHEAITFPLSVAAKVLKKIEETNNSEKITEKVSEGLAQDVPAEEPVPADEDIHSAREESQEDAAAKVPSKMELLKEPVNWDLKAGGKAMFTPAAKRAIVNVDTNAALLSEVRRLGGKDVVVKDAKTGAEKTMNAFAAKYGPAAWRCARAYLEALQLDSVTVTARPRVEPSTLPPEDYAVAHIRNFAANVALCARTIAPGTLSMPRWPSGRYIEGADAFHLTAAMSAVPRWNGCNVFLTEAEMAVFGVKPCSGAEAVFLSKPAGPVWNLMDTDFDPLMKDAVCRRLAEASAALPQPVANLVVSFSPAGKMSDAEAERLWRHFEKVYGMMTEGYDLSPSRLSLETAVKAERFARSASRGEDPLADLRQRLSSVDFRHTPMKVPMVDHAEAMLIDALSPEERARFFESVKWKDDPARHVYSLKAVREYGVPAAAVNELLVMGTVRFQGMTHSRPSTPSSPANPSLDMPTRIVLDLNPRILAVRVTHPTTGKDMGSAQDFFESKKDRNLKRAYNKKKAASKRKGLSGTKEHKR